MEYDRETGELDLDLLEDVEAEGRRNENAVCIALALCGCELVCTMGCTDGDCK